MTESTVLKCKGLTGASFTPFAIRVAQIGQSRPPVYDDKKQEPLSTFLDEEMALVLLKAAFSSEEVVVELPSLEVPAVAFSVEALLDSLAVLNIPDSFGLSAVIVDLYSSTTS